jgi:tRNA uridine 5-carboxymethylaminomethyl modification enzyme
VKHPADCDVVVIGGGHAGVEAAHAAARMGASVILLTLKAAAIGVMSCNPAIGGLGKGHLVREIDALDGVMGLAADSAGIQFRLLNRKKGPAVQGPRAQADRALYRTAVQTAVKARSGLRVFEGEATDLVQDGERVRGVVLADGSVIACQTVVLTSGTFLGGVIHIGNQQQPGGRVGEAPSVRLAARLRGLGLPIGRLKTGTPPRLDGRTIAWGQLENQPGDEEPELFSFLSRGVVARQIACGITHTNSQTHDIIRSNLTRSAMYGGHIEGVGPRYCPSIEDKVVRFADKSAHQIFLEPEGLDDPTVYPNGLSTSLPADVQEAYVRSINGLAQAVITQLGYAIEYDYVDPRALGSDLGLRALPGLYLAGQINGTTGYEEAAAQGLVAGLNAALAAQGRDAVQFSRSTSYIGVMIDDLVTRGVTEPYRMFTSRAEFRLTLRADNADQRLTAWGRDIGCVGDVRWGVFAEKAAALRDAGEALRSRSATARAIAGTGLQINPDTESRSMADVLSLTDASFDHVLLLAPDLCSIDPAIRPQLKRDAQYQPYLARQEQDARALQRDESLGIPRDFDYAAMAGLSFELRAKLERVRPGNLGEASRIDGMTPAALVLIGARLRRDSQALSA